MNLVIASAVAHILKTLVVMSSPEEGNIAVWNELAQHVESCVRALVESIDPVLNSRLLTSLPVWERADVSCGIDVGGSGLEEWITDYCALSIELDSCLFPC